MKRKTLADITVEVLKENDCDGINIKVLLND